MAFDALPASRGGAQSSYLLGASEIDEDRSLLPFSLETAPYRKHSSHLCVRYKKPLIVGIVLLVLGALFLSLSLTVRQNSKPSRIQCPEVLPTSSDLVFFIIGDWGRQGNTNQRTAARMMAQVADCMPPQFILSTGDNFYPHGLEKAGDPQIIKTFLDVYSSLSLQVPWYAVLGNHDYGDGLTGKQMGKCPPKEQQPHTKLSVSQCASTECCYSPLWQVTGSNTEPIPHWHLEQGAHMVSFPEHNLEITFIDTNPLINSYRKQSWSTGVLGGVSSQSPEDQRSQVEELLNSSAAVKLVIGHHPIYSSGEHCQGDGAADCQDMSDWLKPLLLKNSVVAYLCGHEHDLQYIKVKDEGVSYIVSGAGSDVRNGEFKDMTVPTETLFRTDDQGFVAAVLRHKNESRFKHQLDLYYYVSSASQHVRKFSLVV